MAAAAPPWFAEGRRSEAPARRRAPPRRRRWAAAADPVPAIRSGDSVGTPRRSCRRLSGVGRSRISAEGDRLRIRSAPPWRRGLRGRPLPGHREDDGSFSIGPGRRCRVEEAPARRRDRRRRRHAHGLRCPSLGPRHLRVLRPVCGQLEQALSRQGMRRGLHSADECRLLLPRLPKRRLQRSSSPRTRLSRGTRPALWNVMTAVGTERRRRNARRRRPSEGARTGPSVALGGPLMADVDVSSRCHGDW